MTNDERRAELDQRGVKYPEDAKKNDLEKLLEETEQGELSPKAQKLQDKADEEKKATQHTKTSETKLVKSGYDGKGAVAIVKGNLYIRTYTKDNHGNDYKKLAEEFCSPSNSHNGCRMINDDTINKVVVIFQKKNKVTGMMIPATREFKDKEEAIKFKNTVKAGRYIKII